ncbi:hypothetical protein ACHAW6_011144 [Cyclotella cf. meneghiniana]
MGDMEYTQILTENTKWTTLTNPGLYPTGIDDPMPTHEREILVAEHKVKVEEYKTTTEDIIIAAVNEEWIEPLHDERLGFTNMTPLELLVHLTTIAGDLDYFNETNCLNAFMVPWDATENPGTYFVWIWGSSKTSLAIALTYFKSSGEYNAVLHEWDQKRAANKTFQKFGKLIDDEFSKHERQNKINRKVC